MSSQTNLQANDSEFRHLAIAARSVASSLSQSPNLTAGGPRSRLRRPAIITGHGLQRAAKLVLPGKSTTPKPQCQGARLWGLLCALSLCTLVTIAALQVKNTLQLQPLSPMILAFILGAMTAPMLPTAGALPQNTAKLGKLLLRAGIVLLGARISWSALVGVGTSGAVIAVAATGLTMLFTVVVGRLLAVERGLTLLIATGTSICGASAIAAASECTRARREDTGYALVCITAFGTLSMLLYPMLQKVLLLSPAAYGTWTGASLHEMAQVVGAAFAVSEEAGEIATLEKLARVLLLGPVLIALALWLSRKSDDGKGKPMTLATALPSYVVAFLGLAVLNSAGLLPAIVSQAAQVVTPWLLAAGLAAIGLQTRIGAILAKGWRPLALGGLATVFISVMTLALTRLLVA